MADHHHDEDDSVDSAAEAEKYRLISALAVDPNADLFGEGEKVGVVLQPRVLKPKSIDPLAYASVDVWALARSGNIDALKGINILDYWNCMRKIFVFMSVRRFYPRRKLWHHYVCD
jgi:hypothetical protein